MERKIIVYIAASVDGYIATKDDSLQWLMGTSGEGDNGYGEFIATVDTVVMGRRTYDWLIREVGRDGFPYIGLECLVLTNSRTGNDGLVTFINEPVRSLAARLRAKTGKHIWLVGGGSLLHEFIDAKMIDEWIITVAPFVLGDGIPLFQKHAQETALTLVGLKQFGQFAQLHYQAKA